MNLNLLIVVISLVIFLIGVVLGYGLGYRKGNRPFKVIGYMNIDYDNVTNDFMSIGWYCDLPEWENQKYVSFKLNVEKGESNNAQDRSENKEN